jgi:energy-coupling factor transporter ATP-binding protein EcfA2
MRPYIVVKKIPDFDPHKLPFWEIYKKEEKADTIKAGGTLAGKFTQGLSGGQRKLLLFELICQRTADQRDLLILLDEPFSGVTDDFVPFIEDRLKEISKKHNILLVTNDHVEKLTSLADNTIRVSAIDRSVVEINDRDNVDREQAIMALSLGEPFAQLPSHDAYKFFFDVEVVSSGSLLQIAIFAMVTMTFFIGTFWDSSDASAPLVA